MLMRFYLEVPMESSGSEFSLTRPQQQSLIMHL